MLWTGFIKVNQLTEADLACPYIYGTPEHTAFVAGFRAGVNDKIKNVEPATENDLHLLREFLDKNGLYLGYSDPMFHGHWGKTGLLLHRYNRRKK